MYDAYIQARCLSKNITLKALSVRCLHAILSTEWQSFLSTVFTATCDR